mmetsp:Transcript_70131/g.226975  ORF Transcript_70131/g.226975 Transcript_70131/m.226975 type:complete len:279 (-) Transcript_70131:465-1301(-)
MSSAPFASSAMPKGRLSWAQLLPDARRPGLASCMARLWPRPSKTEAVAAGSSLRSTPRAQRLTACSKASAKSTEPSRSRARPEGQEPQARVTPSEAPGTQSSRPPLADTSTAPAGSAATPKGSNQPKPRPRPPATTSPALAPRFQRTTRQFPLSATSTAPWQSTAMPSGWQSCCNPSPLPWPPATISTRAGPRDLRSMSSTPATSAGNGSATGAAPGTPSDTDCKTLARAASSSRSCASAGVGPLNRLASAASSCNRSNSSGGFPSNIPASTMSSRRS